MTRTLRLISLTLILLVLFGCSNSGTKADLQNVSNSNVDQSDSIKAKETLSSYKETTEVHALNTKDKLFVAFDILHRNKFNMEEIESRARNDLKELFPNKKIEVSTDQKLVIEAKKAEVRLTQGKTDNKYNLDNEIDNLFKLAHKKA